MLRSDLEADQPRWASMGPRSDNRGYGSHLESLTPLGVAAFLARGVGSGPSQRRCSPWHIAVTPSQPWASSTREGRTDSASDNWKLSKTLRPNPARPCLSACPSSGAGVRWQEEAKP